MARIVAEAEKRLRGDSGADNPGQTPLSHLPPAPGELASDLRSVGSLSSLSSLSSSTTNDNGLVAADTGHVPEGTQGGPPKELVRIPAKSITKEVEKVSWLQSRDRGDPPLSRTEGEKPLRPYPETPKRASSVGGDVEGLSVSAAASGGSVPVWAGSQTAEQVRGEFTRGRGGSSTPVPQESVPKSVPSGTGVASPSDPTVQSPTGPTPYAPPHTQAAMVSEAGLMQQVSPQAVSPPHQPVMVQQTPSQQQQTFSQPPHLQTASPAPFTPSSQVESADSADSPPFVPTPLPQFNPNLHPVPQIGPLFPKKAGVLPPHIPQSVVADVRAGAARRDGYEDLLREKLKLEGQLEVLQEEAQSTLQERAELQAQVRREV